MLYNTESSEHDDIYTTSDTIPVVHIRPTTGTGHIVLIDDEKCMYTMKGTQVLTDSNLVYLWKVDKVLSRKHVFVFDRIPNPLPTGNELLKHRKTKYVISITKRANK